MAESRFVYVTYIRATPQAIWDELTDPERNKLFWSGYHQQTSWKVGDDYEIVGPDGRAWDTGKVLVNDPPKRLSVTWLHQHDEAMRAEGESTCTFELDAGDGYRHQADGHSRDRRRQLKADRRGLQRLAEHPRQPEEPDRDRKRPGMRAPARPAKALAWTTVGVREEMVRQSWSSRARLSRRRGTFSQIVGGLVRRKDSPKTSKSGGGRSSPPDPSTAVTGGR